MKKIVSACWMMLMALVCALNTSAQNKIKTQKSAPDSVAVARAKWEVIKVSSGIKLKHCSLDSTLFGSRQSINILEVKLKGKNRVGLGEEPQKLKGTSEFAAERHAIAAINGTFFDMRHGGSEDYFERMEK
jgi:hypothetical protein